MGRGNGQHRFGGDRPSAASAGSPGGHKDQFTTLVEHIPDIVARLDRDLRFLYISPAVHAVTGAPPESYIGQPRTNAGIPDEFVRIRDERSRKVFETGREDSLEFPIETPAGVRHFEMRLIPEFADDGSVESLMTLTRDVTERKHVEEALREASRRKDEFLATLAHELRGPLAPLSNMLQVLQRDNADAETLRHARDVMERQLGQMTRLVDDLLDVSRISLGKLELKRQPVDLARVVRTAVETCRPLAEGAKHEVTVELPPEPIFLDADPVRLAQVLSNLLHNACKFTEAGGRIRLSAAREGEQVVIRVADSGIGIPPDKLESVFELFTQVNTALERAHGGLGIGLTLVKRLIEMHGGTVTAHSEGPGRGSEFVVRLPLAQPAAAALEPSAPRNGDSRIATLLRRVLVVDDNRDAAYSLARLLKLDGHEVHTAHDGIEAVEAAQRVGPDLILLDIGLPRLNGYDACRQIRTTLADRKPLVVALTGWGQEADRQKSRDAGFDAHFVKPVDYQRLAKLMDELGA